MLTEQFRINGGRMFRGLHARRQSRIPATSVLILSALLVSVSTGHAAGTTAGNPYLGTIISLVTLGTVPLILAGHSRRIGRSHEALVNLNASAARVPATVISSHIEQFTEELDMGIATKYRPVVRYAYAVDGEQFEADRLTTSDAATLDRKRAEALIANYGEGTLVTALLNPDDPADATLRVELPRLRPFLKIATGATILSVAMIAAAVVLFLTS